MLSRIYFMRAKEKAWSGLSKKPVKYLKICTLSSPQPSITSSRTGDLFLNNSFTLRGELEGKGVCGGEGDGDDEKVGEECEGEGGSEGEISSSEWKYVNIFIIGSVQCVFYKNLHSVVQCIFYCLRDSSIHINNNNQKFEKETQSPTHPSLVKNELSLKALYTYS